jgi:hypothetical protein
MHMLIQHNTFTHLRVLLVSIVLGNLLFILQRFQLILGM